MSDEIDARLKELEDISKQTDKERHKLLAMIMEREEALEKRERALIEREGELRAREVKLEDMKKKLLDMVKEHKLKVAAKKKE